jgi:hypothetical protein
VKELVWIRLFGVSLPVLHVTHTTTFGDFPILTSAPQDFPDL